MTEILLDGHLAYASCLAEDGRAASAPTISSLGLNTLPLYGFDIDRRTATTTATTSDDATPTRSISGKVQSTGASTASGNARRSSTLVAVSRSGDGESVLTVSDDKNGQDLELNR